MELTKQEKKELARLRHEVHMTGELLTLRQLFDRMEIYGDRLCMVEKNKDQIIEHTVRDFRSDVIALGTALLHRGLKGKHFGILSENSYAWVVAFFAVTGGVGVAVPVDKELTKADISGLFQKGDVEIVFFSKKHAETAKYHLAEHPDTIGIVLNGESDGSILSLTDLIAEGKALLDGGEKAYLDAKVEKEDMAAIIFTSGTTGANKGVMLSHGNLAQNAEGVLESIAPEYSSLSFLPMNHVYELSGNVLTALYMNAVIYINDSLKNFRSNLNLFKPDAMAVVPLVVDTIYNTIWRTAEATGRDKVLRKALKISNFMLDKLHIDVRRKLFASVAEKFGGKFPTFSCGGAPTRVEYVKCLCDMGFRIYNGYGLTEASPTVTLNLDCRTRPDCAGYPFPKAKYMIHEPDAAGVGEIWIKGENVTKGYYKDEAATAASFEDGWFKTGDYGRQDEEGRLYIVGRKKNLIVLDNGKNVFPEEVESFFMEHIDYVHEVVIFDTDITRKRIREGIIVAAMEIDLNDFPGKTEEEVRQQLKADFDAANRQLPGYKRAKDLFISTTPFEINSTRKVIRSKVVERYQASQQAK